MPMVAPSYGEIPIWRAYQWKLDAISHSSPVWIRHTTPSVRILPVALAALGLELEIKIGDHPTSPCRR